MKCTVYRSSKKDFTYLYLSQELALEDLPSELAEVFGEPKKVMQLDLTPERTLAQEDVATVRENLATQGYHLQLPPKEDPRGWLELAPVKRPD